MPIPKLKKCLQNNHLNMFSNSNSNRNFKQNQQQQNQLFQFDEMDPLILPTPPRSPSSKSSHHHQPTSSSSSTGYYGGQDSLVHDEVLDDLFQLLENDGDEDEESNMEQLMNQSISRKRKLSELSLLSGGNAGQSAAEISLDNALLELGFVQEHSENGAESDASYLIDHLLSSYRQNDSSIDYESPPPTNPPSPVASTAAQESAAEIYSEDYYSKCVKSEPQSSAASSIDYDSDSDSYTEDLLKDFESFDTFEKLASSSTKNTVESYIGSIYSSSELDGGSSEYDFKPKRIKFDSESTEDQAEGMMKNDCMWNAPLFSTFGDLLLGGGGDQNNQQFNSADCVEEIVATEEEEADEELQQAKHALVNDHSYAMPCRTDGAEDIKSEVVESHEEYEEENVEIEIDNKHATSNNTQNINYINFDKIQKKTKILVPLKHLMETLQQKSYLVSPLGPGKKVIRLTGTGETVKGVFSSSGLLTLPSSSSCSSSSSHQSMSISTKPSNHNVRKRPHNPILNTRYTSPKLIEPVSSTTSSIEDHHHHQSLLLNSNAPIVTKKKTKAHNNMERMRRIDLRNSFDNLKKLVPILAKSPKCSKVEILKKAEEFIRSLRAIEKKFVKDEQMLKIKHQQLKLKIEQQNMLV